MEYQVLARKWRPRKFEEVVGQEHVTITLRNAITSGRIGHVYLFTGPRGIGKTTIARIFAKALNCEKGPAAEPCDVCRSCSEVTQGNNLDVLEIDGASNTSVDDVRGLRENVKFSPAGGRYKIYIIDEVHMLSTSAFNALLKTLEEPPLHVKFFFATTEPDRLPETILSRCQRFDLRKIPGEKIVGRLKQIVEEEKITVSEEALYLISRYAEGSMRDAQSILDQIIAFSGNTIEKKDVSLVLGLVDQEIISRLVKAIAERDSATAVTTLNSVIEQGKDLQLLLIALAEYFRNMLILKVTDDAETLLNLSHDTVEEIRALTGRFKETDILYLLDILIQTERQLKFALSKRVLAEAMLIKMITSLDRISIDRLIERVLALESRLREVSQAGNKPGPFRESDVPDLPDRGESTPEEKRDNPGNTPGKKAEAAGVSHDNLFERVKEDWTGILGRIGKNNPLVRSYLLEGAPLSFVNNTLVIGFDGNSAFHMEALETVKNKQIVEKKFSESLRHDIKVAFRIIKENDTGKKKPVKHKPSETNTASAQTSGSDAGKEQKNHIKKNPIIRKALDLFEGTVIDVKK